MKKKKKTKEGDDQSNKEVLNLHKKLFSANFFENIRKEAEGSKRCKRRGFMKDVLRKNLLQSFG